MTIVGTFNLWLHGFHKLISEAYSADVQENTKVFIMIKPVNISLPELIGISFYFRFRFECFNVDVRSSNSAEDDVEQ